MYTIHDMPPQVEGGLLDLLARCETATIGHFMHDCFLDRRIAAVLPDARVAGTAVTLRLAGEDSALLHYAVSHARPGDVLVIDRAGDDRHACWGGVVTHAAKAASVAAGIIDGPATDFGEIRGQGMPIWCRGPSPVTTKMLGLAGGLNVEISCGGQAVSPGDAILADESGVLALKPRQVEEVAGRAIGMQEAEQNTLEKIRGGARLSDLTRAGKLVEDLRLR